MSLSESHGRVAVLEPSSAKYFSGLAIAGAAFLLLCVLTLGVI